MLTGNSLTWHSNIDGNFGSGNLLENVALSAGEHTITLTAIDSAGFSRNDQISLEVFPDDSCTPPSSGNWIISQNCTLSASTSAPENVLVSAGNTLTIAEKIILEIDFSQYDLLIHDGANVRIETGGKIQQK